MNDLPTLFRNARKEKKLSREALAKKAGVSIGAIGYLEHGERMPGPLVLSSLAMALNIRLPEGALPPGHEVNVTLNDPSIEAFRGLRMLANSEQEVFSRVVSFMSVGEVTHLTRLLVNWLGVKATGGDELDEVQDDQDRPGIVRRKGKLP